MSATAIPLFSLPPPDRTLPPVPPDFAAIAAECAGKGGPLAPALPDGDYTLHPFDYHRGDFAPYTMRVTLFDGGKRGRVRTADVPTAENSLADSFRDELAGHVFSILRDVVADEVADRIADAAADGIAAPALPDILEFEIWDPLTEDTLVFVGDDIAVALRKIGEKAAWSQETIRAVKEKAAAVLEDLRAKIDHVLDNWAEDAKYKT